MLLSPLPHPPPFRNPHRAPPAQPLQIPGPMTRSRVQSPPRRLAARRSAPDRTRTDDGFLVRRRRHVAVLAQDALRGWHEVLLVHVQNGAGREVQEAFEKGVVLRCKPGWLAVWAAGGWAWVGHCWLVRYRAVKLFSLEVFFLSFFQAGHSWTTRLPTAFSITSQMVVLPEW